MTGSKAIILGAKSGIGYEWARQLNADGKYVVAVDKYPFTLSPLSNPGELRLIDLSLPFASDALGVAYNYDFAIFSVGVSQMAPGKVNDAEQKNINETNVETVRNAWNAIHPKLQRGATIWFVSSDMIFDDSAPYPAYRASKREMTRFALNLVGSVDARIGIAFPGPVDTPLFSGNKSLRVIEDIRRTVGIMTPFDLVHQMRQVEKAISTERPGFVFYANRPVTSLGKTDLLRMLSL